MVETIIILVYITGVLVIFLTDRHTHLSEKEKNK